MRFEDPGMLVLLPGALLIIFLYWKLFLFRKSVVEQLSIGLRERSRTIFILKAAAAAFAWSMIVIALMQPQANPRYEESRAGKTFVETERQVPQDVFLLIDASASMAVPDGGSGATRLDAAKEIAELLIEQLRGQNVGLYAFTAEAEPLSPPTPDYLFTVLTLREMKINEGDTAGTDLAEAMTALVKEYGGDSSLKRHTVVVFSDGGDPSADGSSKEMQRLLKNVHDLNKKGWEFIAVGVGTPIGGTVPGVEYQGAPVRSALNNTPLKEIAKASKGHFYDAYQTSKPALAKKIAQTILEKGNKSFTTEGMAAGQVVYTEYFRLPLALAALLLLFILLYPEAVRRRL